MLEQPEYRLPEEVLEVGPEAAFSPELPRYTSPESLQAEKNLDKILKLAADLGVRMEEMQITPAELLNIASKIAPQRLSKVENKLAAHGLQLSRLSASQILDKLYGTDRVISFEGQKFFIDVTTAKSTALKNKMDKTKELEELLRAVGCDHAIVLKLMTKEIDDRVVLEFAAALESADGFVEDIRINTLPRETGKQKPI